MDLEAVDELIAFLNHSRRDLRQQAVDYVFQLTDTESGISTLLLSTSALSDEKTETTQSVCGCLLKLVGDEPEISMKATQALVNLTTNPRARITLMQHKSFWSRVLEILMDRINSVLKATAEKEGILLTVDTARQNQVTEKDITVFQVEIESCLKLVNNMTTMEEGAKKLLEGRFATTSTGLDGKPRSSVGSLLGYDVTKLLEFCFQLEAGSETDLESAGLKIELMMKILVNLTQIDLGRDYLIGNDSLPEKTLSTKRGPVFPAENAMYLCRAITYCLSKTLSVRNAAVKIIRNISFEQHYHPLLLSAFEMVRTLPITIKEAEEEDAGIVYYLMYNLVGLTEEDDPYFSDKDEESSEILSGFPNFYRDRIQQRDEYLIEQDDETRLCIIEALFLLSGSKAGREQLRAAKVYEVIKRYHTEEENEAISEKIFELVERLLGDEDVNDATVEAKEEQQKQDLLEALSRDSVHPTSDEQLVEQTSTESVGNPESVLYDIDA